jgi:hypothetical protein
VTAGRPVPRRAWLNALAHRPPERVVALTSPHGGSGADPWRDMVALVAHDLVEAGAAQASHLQRALFVPLELASLTRADWPASPDDVLGAVERCLHPQRRPPSHPQDRG